LLRKADKSRIYKTGQVDLLTTEHHCPGTGAGKLNLAAFEARMQQYATDPELRSKMQGYTDLWVTGSREILRVV